MSKFRELSGVAHSLNNMKAKSLATWVITVTLVFMTLVTSNLTTARSEIRSEAAYADQPVVGLAIKYRNLVSPKNLAGTLVGLEPIENQVSSFDDIGLGVWSVKFKSQKSEQEALGLAGQLASDSRIEAIYLDHFLSNKTSVRLSPTLGGMRASTAPVGLSVVDAWSSSRPTTAALRLTWSRPNNLNGGVIWGYRISQWDSATGSFKDLVSNTKTTTTRFTVTNNLTAGTTARFRVAAVTKNTSGTRMAISAYSSTVQIVPTTAPEKPVLQSSGTITSSAATVSWLSQTRKQKGGLATTYSVSAVADDQTIATCTSTSTQCTLSGLQAGKNYQVRVTATNAKGSAISDIVSESRDPMYSQQWYLNSEYGINVEAAWKLTKGSPNVVVAVVDSGITNHPDLAANVVAGYDFISSSSNARDGNGRDADPTDPGDYNSTENSSWHGTHVAGIIAAAENGIGITGIAPNVKISPVRVLGVNGGSETDIAAGINWAIGVAISGVPTNRNTAKVVNLSIGSTSFTTCYSNSPTQLAINESKKRDVTLVTAAGNDERYATSSYPGNCYGNITIGATGYTGDRAWYSNFSYYSQSQGIYIGVDISAPGGDDRVGASAPADGAIWSTWNTGKTSIGEPTYEGEMGTSMASPIAAGVVALMYSIKPNLTDDQVWEILSSTSKKFNPTSDCTYLRDTVTLQDGSKLTTGLCGIGIIDAGAAVLATKNLN